MAKTYQIVNNGGNHQVTIPQSLATALGFKIGDKIVWTLNGNDSLILTKVEE